MSNMRVIFFAWKQRQQVVVHLRSTSADLLIRKVSPQTKKAVIEVRLPLGQKELFVANRSNIDHRSESANIKMNTEQKS